MTTEAQLAPLLDDEEFLSDHSRVSPNGRWIAYVANVPQGDRVFVRSFPHTTGGGRWQVSPYDGDDPVWSIDGHELFYFGSQGQVLGVAVEDGPTFSYSGPDVVLEGPYVEIGGVQYDVTPDGRFLVLKQFDDAGAEPTLEVVLNWFEELKRLVPVE